MYTKMKHCNIGCAGILNICLIVTTLQACTSGAENAGGGNNNQQVTLDHVNKLFPFIPNQPFDVIFACQRNNSQLLYTFDFNSNGSFDLYSTLNNGQDVMYSGVYTYQNNQLHLQSQNPMLPLDERSTNIESLLGLLYRLQTRAMDCIAIGHRYNNPAQEFSTTVHYSCPIINIQPASDDSNAIEFVHRNMPFSLAIPGSAFRQRDRNIQGTTQPNILRGYGIYRRQGDRFYIYFNNLFDDANLLTGQFVNGDQQIRIDQLEPSAGNCSL